ncbi:MAG: dynamin family protein [Hyphomicrobiaceae bacterium]|nr:dynamin family protein [Hyphomicrobiaceae bacterium]
MAEHEIASSLQVVNRLREARVRLEALTSEALPLEWTIRALKRMEQRLARPVRVAILGEFNAGKSTLANVLAGIDSLPTAVVSATRYPTLLIHKRTPEVWAVHFDGRREALRVDKPVQSRSIARLEVGLPLPWLDNVQLLDLPGLGDPYFLASYVDLSANGVDAVLWCTVSTQAWKESEREAWDQLPVRLRNRAILVVTHADLLRSREDRDKLLLRLRSIAEPGAGEIVVFSSKLQADSGEAEMRSALERLTARVRHERSTAALRVVSRISERVLSRLPAG